MTVRRRRLAQVLLALAAAAMTLLGSEMVSRAFDPHPELVPYWVWEGEAGGAGTFEYVEDEELGYRPVLGTADYSEAGTLVNDHALEKRPGVARLLFLGDSVARSTRLQRALRAACPDAPIEIWTAAVEGYNAVQEVAFYRRWSRRTEPDHLTLLFHNNDFLATPVVFPSRDGGLRIAIGPLSLSRLELSLLKASNLYRHGFRRRLRRLREKDTVTTRDATRAALAELKQVLEEDDVELTVLLLPVFEPLEEWTESERRSRLLARELLAELELPFFDLLEPLESALRSGANVQEKPGDRWHPSRQAARHFVRHLLRKGYLEGYLDPADCRPSGPHLPAAADLPGGDDGE